MSRQAAKADQYVRVATRHGENTSPSLIVAKRLKIAVAGAMFAGLALSPKLWLSERVYPLTPVVSFLGPIPAPLDLVIYAALLILLILIAIVARPAKFIGAFAALAIVVALFDQSRWQPWFYQYLIMFGAIAWYYRNSKEDDGQPALNACRLIVVCTYFWSGLQKLQPGFMFQLFPWMIASFTSRVPHSLATAMNTAGIVAPFIEIVIGIGLLIPRFRRHAIFAGIGMHAFILLALGPLGKNYNSVVWPWNVAMVAFLFILFWEHSNRPVRAILWPRGAYGKVVVLFFGIVPALSFVDLWDKDLSCAMYTGLRYEPLIYVTNALAERLPREIQNNVYVSKKPDTNVLNVLDWSLEELNAAAYPEPRIYKSLGKRVCSYAHDPSEMRMVIRRRNVLFSPDREDSYTCPDLAK